MNFRLRSELEWVKVPDANYSIASQPGGNSPPLMGDGDDFFQEEFCGSFVFDGGLEKYSELMSVAEKLSGQCDFSLWGKLLMNSNANKELSNLLAEMR